MKRELRSVAADPNQEESQAVRWRTCLEDQSRSLYGALRKEVTDTHSAETFRSGERMFCDRCRHDKHRLDLVELVCCPEKRANSCQYDKEALPPPHTICHSCMALLVRQQESFMDSLIVRERRLHRGDEVQTAYIRGLLAKLIPCPLCKSPNVLTVQTAFNEGYLRKTISKDGTITQYQVHAKATAALRDNFSVEEVYENQRRPLFGCFSAKNLQTLDFRGPFSTEKGCEVPYEQTRQKPNKNWVWLELDAPDTTLLKAADGGWMYGREWRDSQKQYERDISLFHFVRTRRLLHTRVRISEEVREQLDLLHEAELAKMQK